MGGDDPGNPGGWAVGPVVPLLTRATEALLFLYEPSHCAGQQNQPGAALEDFDVLRRALADTSPCGWGRGTQGPVGRCRGIRAHPRPTYTGCDVPVLNDPRPKGGGRALRPAGGFMRDGTDGTAGCQFGVSFSLQLVKKTSGTRANRLWEGRRGLSMGWTTGKGPGRNVERRQI